MTQECFVSLVERNRKAARNVVLRMGFSEDDADDIVATAVMRAWRSRDTLDVAHGFGSWLCAITKNYALDQGRRLRRMVTAVSYDAPILTGRTGCDGADFLDACGGSADTAREIEAREELRAVMRSAKKALAPGKYRVLEAFVKGDGDFKACYESLDMTQGTVRSTMSKVRRQLEEALA